MRALFFDQNNMWRPGWRIVAMIVLTSVVVIGINAGWRALGLPGRQETGAGYFLLFAALISGCTFGVVLLALRYFEKQGTSAIGLPFRREAWKETAAGALLGAIPVCLLLGLAVIAGYGTVSPAGMSAAGLIAMLLPMLLAGFLLAAWEELVLRGYLLRQLTLGLSASAAVIITGVLFGLMHSDNPGANWQGVLYTAVSGILMGWLMVRSGSLWLLIGYHFGWNATAAGLFGLELSGFDENGSVFTSTLSGADWLTGGSYGFEASLPAVVFEVLVLSVALGLAGRARSESKKA